MANTKIPVELSSTPGIVDNSNATAITIDSSERVGIGTASPTRTFEVNSGATNVVARFESTDSRAVVELKDPSGSAELGGIGSDIYFAPAGVEKVRIESSGNVGIGTSSPSVNLHVSDSADARIIVDDVGSGSSIQIRSDGASSYIGTTSNTDLRLVANNAERMRIDSSGNVGIGTTSPVSPLQVNVGTNLNLGVNEDSSTLRLSVYDDAASSSQPMTINSSSTRFDISGTEAMRINSSGLILIGTTSSSGSSVKLEAHDATNPIIQVKDTTSNIICGIQAGNSEAVIRCPQDSPLVFNVGASETERMRIDGSGNVMFGTTTVTPATTSVTGVSALNDGRLHVSAQSQTALFVNRMATDGTVVEFRNDATIVGSVSFSGAITSYNTTSDARLKDVTGEARGLEVINELNPVAYNWKESGQADEGLIAQEVLEIVPNAVTHTEEDIYQMDYSKLVVHLVKGMKEQQAQIEALQSEINELKNS